MNQTTKKIPLRKCVITGEQHPKQEMFRIVRLTDGTVVVDETGKARGHGVYLVKDEKTINLAWKRHTLDKYLEVKVSDDIYEQLLSILKK